MQNVGFFLSFCLFLLPFVYQSEWHTRWTSRYCTFHVNLICLCLVRVRSESEHNTCKCVWNCCNCWQNIERERETAEGEWNKSRKSVNKQQCHCRWRRNSLAIEFSKVIHMKLHKRWPSPTWLVDRSVGRCSCNYRFRVIDFKIWNSLNETQSSVALTPLELNINIVRCYNGWQ